MEKKQKYSRAPEPEDNMTYSEELAAQQQPQEPVEQLNAEEESYKKRYQDIQRHIQTVRDQAAQDLGHELAALLHRIQARWPEQHRRIRILDQP